MPKMLRTDDDHLEVITGPMFSGKSEELMRRVHRARSAGGEVGVVTHSLATRSSNAAIRSHAGGTIPALQASDVAALAAMARSGNYQLMAIDEAQFFGPGLLPVATGLVASGCTVLIAGLCVTFEGEPFEPLPALMSVAEQVLKLTAVCGICGREAVFHQRLTLTGQRTRTERAPATTISSEHIGGIESYSARCRRHFRTDDFDPALARPRSGAC